MIRNEELAAAEQAEAAGGGVTPSLWLFGGLLAAIPAALFGAFRRFGREPKVAYDREYEQAPPSDLEPALVPALLSQGRVDEKGFTATLFDLIRRGVLTASPETVERVTWAGLRREQISDLVIGLAEGDTGPLREHETRVMTVMRRVLDEGPQPLTQFRTRIRADAEANANTYDSFRDVGAEGPHRPAPARRDRPEGGEVALGAGVAVGHGRVVPGPGAALGVLVGQPGGGGRGPLRLHPGGRPGGPGRRRSPSRPAPSGCGAPRPGPWKRRAGRPSAATWPTSAACRRRRPSP